MDTSNAGNIYFIWYISLLAHPLIFISVIKGVEEHGLYKSILFSSVIQSFAIFFGQIETYGPWIGEILNSICGVINFTLLTKYSGAWFGQRGRIYATATLLAITFIGSDFAETIGRSYKEETDSERSLQGRFIAFFALSLVSTILIAFFMKDKPNLYPTNS